MSLYKSTLGKMLFLERMTEPIMRRVVSQIAIKTAQLEVHHFKDLAAQIRYVKRTLPCITFPAVPPRCALSPRRIYRRSMAGKKEGGTRGTLRYFDAPGMLSILFIGVQES